MRPRRPPHRRPLRLGLALPGLAYVSLFGPSLRPQVLTAIGVERLPAALQWGAPRGGGRIRPDTRSNALAPTAQRRGAFHLLRDLCKDTASWRATIATGRRCG